MASTQLNRKQILQIAFKTVAVWARSKQRTRSLFIHLIYILKRINIANLSELSIFVHNAIFVAFWNEWNERM